MAKIKFENGTVVNFEGDPTPQDIEEVASGLNLSQLPVKLRDIQTGPRNFGETYLGQFLKTSKDIAIAIPRGIVEPPVKLFGQAGLGIESLMSGKPPLKYNFPFPKILRGSIPIKAPKTILQALGPALQTSALALSPVTGGAAYGAGMALEETKSPIEIAKQATIGGLFGGAMAKVVGQPIIPGRIGQKIEKSISGSAEKNYRNVLGKLTTKEEKMSAEKLIPELLKRKPFVWTRSGLGSASERNRISTNDKLNEAWSKLPKTEKVDIEPIIDNVNGLQKDLKVGGVLLEQNTTEAKVLENIKENLIDMSKDKKINPQTLREYRQSLDKFISARKKGFTLSDADSAALSARKGMANSIRNEIGKKYPDIGKINKEYSYWSGLSSLLKKTIEKDKPILDQVGGVIGDVGGQKAAGFFIKNLGRLITDNVAWNSLSGSIKSRIAGLLSNGDISSANRSIIGIIKEYNLSRPKGRKIIYSEKIPLEGELLPAEKLGLGYLPRGEFPLFTPRKLLPSSKTIYGERFTARKPKFEDYIRHRQNKNPGLSKGFLDNLWIEASNLQGKSPTIFKNSFTRPQTVKDILSR